MAFIDLVLICVDIVVVLNLNMNKVFKNMLVSRSEGDSRRGSHTKLANKGKVVQEEVTLERVEPIAVIMPSLLGLKLLPPPSRMTKKRRKRIPSMPRIDCPLNDRTSSWKRQL